MKGQDSPSPACITQLVLGDGQVRNWRCRHNQPPKWCKHNLCSKQWTIFTEHYYSTRPHHYHTYL